MLGVDTLHIYGNDGEKANEGFSVDTPGEDVLEVLPRPSPVPDQGGRMDRVEQSSCAGLRMLFVVVPEVNEWQAFG